MNRATATKNPPIGTGIHTVTVHGMGLGDDHEQVSVVGPRVDATLSLDDGRTVQVALMDNGRVMVRAWPGQPYTTNNLDAVSVAFTLPTLEDMVLDGAAVRDVSLSTTPVTERSMPSPEQHDGTWPLCDQAEKDRVTGIRAVLALRTDPTQENPDG